MKLLCLSFLLFLGSSAYAKSNIAATWIDHDQVLSVRIVDDPSSSPYVAGEIWRAMRGTGKDRTIKTEQFELKCSGSVQTNGSSFGNCKIRVARDTVVTHPGQTNFAISKNEAQLALAEFEQPLAQESILIKSGITDAYGHDMFMFEVNWRYQMIAAVMDQSLVSP